MEEDKIKEWMNQSLPEAFDRCYNLAIDHATEVVDKFLLYVPGLSKPLIEKLQSLKK